MRSIVTVSAVLIGFAVPALAAEPDHANKAGQQSSPAASSSVQPSSTMQGQTNSSDAERRMKGAHTGSTPPEPGADKAESAKMDQAAPSK